MTRSRMSPALSGGTGMDLKLHDRVELKKPHPCGANEWEIVRVGMDIKFRCQGCGHEVMLPRSKAVKRIRRVLETGGDNG